MPIRSVPLPVVDVDAEGVHPRLVIGLLALQLLFLLQLLLKSLAVCILRMEIAQVATAFSNLYRYSVCVLMSVRSGMCGICKQLRILRTLSRRHI